MIVSDMEWQDLFKSLHGISLSLLSLKLITHTVSKMKYA